MPACLRRQQSIRLCWCISCCGTAVCVHRFGPASSIAQANATPLTHSTMAVQPAFPLLTFTGSNASHPCIMFNNLGQQKNPHAVHVAAGANPSTTLQDTHQGMPKAGHTHLPEACLGRYTAARQNVQTEAKPSRPCSLQGSAFLLHAARLKLAGPQGCFPQLLAQLRQQWHCCGPERHAQQPTASSSASPLHGAVCRLELSLRQYRGLACSCLRRLLPQRLRKLMYLSARMLVMRKNTTYTTMMAAHHQRMSYS